LVPVFTGLSGGVLAGFQGIYTYGTAVVPPQMRATRLIFLEVTTYIGIFNK